MIADTLNNSPLYRGLSPRIALAFDYLRGTDLRRAATGTVEIDGRRVYAIVQEYATLDRAQGTWEAHRRYIDLQHVVSRHGADRLRSREPVGARLLRRGEGPPAALG